ncbi:MAG: hypothetical protein K9G59_14630 [Caulobacter sp.]|nr:hypothetical protein [Caulobacter sp.]
MRKAVVAGILYFAVVFAFAFAIGVVRVLLVAPRLGETVAVLLELPVVLAASWACCGALVTRLAVSPRLGDRVMMGGVAFVVLQAAEALLAVFAFGRTPALYLAAFATLAGQLGLAGQIGFALIPLVRRRR